MSRFERIDRRTRRIARRWRIASQTVSLGRRHGTVLDLAHDGIAGRLAASTVEGVTAPTDLADGPPRADTVADGGERLVRVRHPPGSDRGRELGGLGGRVGPAERPGEEARHGPPVRLELVQPAVVALGHDGGLDGAAWVSSCRRALGCATAGGPLEPHEVGRRDDRVVGAVDEEDRSGVAGDGRGSPTDPPRDGRAAGGRPAS